MALVTIKNKKICYETLGNPDDPAIILVMGILGQLVHWPSEFVEGLAAAGFYVVFFDNRDVGLSSYYDHIETPELMDAIAKLQKAEDIVPAYTLSDMADDIVDLMDALSIEKAYMFGLSMGGQIAQVFALQYSERLLGLSLLATSSGDPSLPQPSPDVLNFFFSTKDSSVDALTAHIEQYQLYHPHDFDRNYVSVMHEKAYQRAYHPAGLQRHLLAIMTAKPRIDVLRKIKVKTLVIHGDCDPVVSIEHGEQLAKIIPDAKLAVIHDMGHGITPNNSAKIVALVQERFLAD